MVAFSTEINLKFSIVKLPKAIMAERSVLVKRELISNLPQAKRRPRRKSGHKDRGQTLFGGCALAMGGYKEVKCHIIFPLLITTSAFDHVGST